MRGKLRIVFSETTIVQLPLAIAFARKLTGNCQRIQRSEEKFESHITSNLTSNASQIVPVDAGLSE
jgi:hypothetical protein